MEEVEKVIDNNEIIAIILRKKVRAKGTKFFTPNEFSQQLGLLEHEKGKVVRPHRHKRVKREIIQTQEVLILLEGKIKIDLFNEKFEKRRTIELASGDVILFSSGAHGIEILETSKIIEVKQGPYAGFDDKEYFN